MTQQRRIVRLGDVLSKTDESLLLSSNQTYREVTVRLWGKGVRLRRVIKGADIGARRRSVVRAGQFILSRIDARNGAFGLVPQELDGAVVSNDFPSYLPNPDQMTPEYLKWMSRTRAFIDLCHQASEGTTNRVRLKEERFLAMRVSLPHIDEQRSLARTLDELARKIDYATRIYCELALARDQLWEALLARAFESPTACSAHLAKDLLQDQATALADTAHENHNHNRAHPSTPNVHSHGLFALPNGWVWTDLGSVLTHLVDCVNDTPDFVDQPTGYIGLKSTNVRPYVLDLSQTWNMTGEDFARWNRREQPRPNDLLLTREAPMGNVCPIPPSCPPLCMTQRLMLLRTDDRFVSPRYLLHYLNSIHFKRQVMERCRGLTTPHIRVKDAPEFLVPLPPFDAQCAIASALDATQEKLLSIYQSHQTVDSHLSALLPAILNATITANP